MSVLIKGMKMPRACQVCPLGHWNKLDKLTGCEIVRRYVPKDDIEFWEKDKPRWCPLVEVPTPHGRLIDADAIEYTHAIARCIEDGHNWNELCVTADEICDMPTIIEAEEGANELPSAQPEQRYTEEELRVYQHGISLSLLSKRSAQHWHYDEDTATEIKFLERLYDKVGADMRGEQDEY